jgi:hypothetical protein
MEKSNSGVIKCILKDHFDGLLNLNASLFWKLIGQILKKTS